MGAQPTICCCVGKDTPDQGEAHVQEWMPCRRKKSAPLLQDLEEMFYEFADEDKALNIDGLRQMWERAIRQKEGRFTDEDATLVQACCEHYFKEMDLDCGGDVSLHEFLLYSLGGAEDRGPLRTMRMSLNHEIAENPEVLHEIIKYFKRWDKDGDGRITPEEIEASIEELSDKYGVDNSAVNHSKEMKEVIFKEADVDQDGNVDLWEVAAHTLGRRKRPVELLVYDVSSGLADTFGKAVFGQEVAFVHSSVLAFGGEWWYGGQLYRTPPPCTAVFGPPMSNPWGMALEMSEAYPALPVIRVGYTFMREKEFVEWLKTKSSEYTRESYDLLTHSCNHFTNEVVEFLTGALVPQQVLETQRRMIQNKTLQNMRPFLNKYFGGFADCDKELVHGTAFTEDYMPERMRNSKDIIQSVLGEGDVVVINGDFIDGVDGEAVATIIARDTVNQTMDLRYFDPQQQKVATLRRIPEKHVKRDSRRTIRTPKGSKETSGAR